MLRVLVSGLLKDNKVVGVDRLGECHGRRQLLILGVSSVDRNTLGTTLLHLGNVIYIEGSTDGESSCIWVREVIIIMDKDILEKIALRGYSVYRLSRGSKPVVVGHSR
jgi:hypothetical protein